MSAANESQSPGRSRSFLEPKVGGSEAYNWYKLFVCECLSLIANDDLNCRAIENTRVPDIWLLSSASMREHYTDMLIVSTDHGMLWKNKAKRGEARRVMAIE